MGRLKDAAPMTEDEAIERLAEIGGPAHLGDIETAHVNADALVAEALDALGWRRFAKAYKRRGKHWWYA